MPQARETHSYTDVELTAQELRIQQVGHTTWAAPAVQEPCTAQEFRPDVVNVTVREDVFNPRLQLWVAHYHRSGASEFRAEGPVIGICRAVEKILEIRIL